ncbi:outer membrane lipoprotein-sorting protein [Caldithrix abyssi]|nr:outer membrane lipoprotein-sorting protein [Caldithrix abyssi]
MKKFNLFLLFGIINAQIPSGEAIIDSMTAIMSTENSKGLIRQTNHYEDGRTRSFELEMFSTGKGEKAMMRYLKPSSVKGQTFLMLNDGDDIWTYFPRTRRIRKLASHAKKQKVQGSDFSFEDFSSEDMWKKDYTSKILGEMDYEGTVCWKLEATVNPGADVDFPTVIMYIRQTDFYPLYMDYLDDKGRKEKSLYLSDIREIDGYPTALKMVMKNHLTGTKTVMETKEISFRWTPPKGFFSERNLKK